MREKLKEKYFITKLGIIDTNFWVSDKFMYKVGQKYVILPEHDGGILDINETLDLIEQGGMVGTIIELKAPYWTQQERLVIKCDDGTVFTWNPTHYRLSWNILPNKNKMIKNTHEDLQA